MYPNQYPQQQYPQQQYPQMQYPQQQYPQQQFAPQQYPQQPMGYPPQHYGDLPAHVLFSMADSDGNGTIDFYEFSVFLEARKYLDLHKKQQGFQQQYFQAQNCHPKFQQLIYTLSQYLMQQGVPQHLITAFQISASMIPNGYMVYLPSGESARDLFSMADTDGNGTIDIQEFSIFLALQDASLGNLGPNSPQNYQDAMNSLPPKKQGLINSLAEKMKSRGFKTAAVIGFVAVAAVAAAGVGGLAYYHRDKIANVGKKVIGMTGSMVGGIGGNIVGGQVGGQIGNMIGGQTGQQIGNFTGQMIGSYTGSMMGNQMTNHFMNNYGNK